MFRKLVSNLPYSPALVGQLGLYVGRLRKEVVIRKIGLLFVVAALVVQSFALLNPPVQASASSNAAVIPGGVSSVQEIIHIYDSSRAGGNDFKPLMDYFGVTRSELATMNTNVTYICSSDRSIVSFGREHHYSSSEGELSHTVQLAQGGTSTFYSVPLYRFDEGNGQTACYDSFVGYSKQVGWFAIMRKCGNFQIKQDARTLPRAHLVSATCSTIQGFAYDERDSAQKVKVYLYLGGPPGKGKQYGPVVADSPEESSPVGKGHGFSFAVPDAYVDGSSPIQITAVMQPLAGWTDPMVHADNTVQIPSHCKAQKTPMATCSVLSASRIDRTRFQFRTAATANGGAIISGYEYIVLDKDGKKVFDKTYPSTNPGDVSEIIDLKNPGAYKASVIAKTSEGDRQSTECSQSVYVGQVGQCQFNPSFSQTDKKCLVCPYDTGLWIKDNDCSPHIVLSKQARNLSQNNIDANNTTANQGDRVQYDLYTTNIGYDVIGTSIRDTINDLLQYATVIDSGGATIDAGSANWGNDALAHNQTDIRSFIIQIDDVISSTPRAANDPAAYDCTITNSYGDTTRVKMPCPIGKQIEGYIRQLPSIGVGGNILFAGTALLVTTYLYARSRQLHKEARIIRREFNGGSL